MRCYVALKHHILINAYKDVYPLFLALFTADIDIKRRRHAG